MSLAPREAKKGSPAAGTDQGFHFHLNMTARKGARGGRGSGIYVLSLISVSRVNEYITISRTGIPIAPASALAYRRSCVSYLS